MDRLDGLQPGDQEAAMAAVHDRPSSPSIALLPPPSLFLLPLLRIRSGYKSYDDYIKHQLNKTLNPRLRRIWATRDWDRKVLVFSHFFSDLRSRGLLSNASRALCVGACLGQEVAALSQIGVADAVGMDPIGRHRRSLPPPSPSRDELRPSPHRPPSLLATRLLHHPLPRRPPPSPSSGSLPLPNQNSHPRLRRSPLKMTSSARISSPRHLHHRPLSSTRRCPLAELNRVSLPLRLHRQASSPPPGRRLPPGLLPKHPTSVTTAPASSPPRLCPVRAFQVHCQETHGTSLLHLHHQSSSFFTKLWSKARRSLRLTLQTDR